MSYIGDLFYVNISKIFYTDHYLKFNTFLGLDSTGVQSLMNKYEEHKKLEV